MVGVTTSTPFALMTWFGRTSGWSSRRLWLRRLTLWKRRRRFTRPRRRRRRSARIGTVSLRCRRCPITNTITTTTNNLLGLSINRRLHRKSFLTSLNERQQVLTLPFLGPILNVLVSDYKSIQFNMLSLSHIDIFRRRDIRYRTFSWIVLRYPDFYGNIISVGFEGYWDGSL